MPESSDKGDRHDSAHSKPLSALGIKKIRMGKIVADLGEYRGLRVTRNTAGIRYLYRLRRSHSDKLIHGTLPQYFTPGNYSDPVVPRYSLAFLMSLVRVFPAIK